MKKIISVVDSVKYSNPSWRLSLQASMLSPESLATRPQMWLLDMQAHPSHPHRVLVLLAAIHPVKNDLILALGEYFILLFPRDLQTELRR